MLAGIALCIFGWAQVPGMGSFPAPSTSVLRTCGGWWLLLLGPLGLPFWGTFALCEFFCFTESMSFSSFGLLLRICCCFRTASHCRTIFLAFSKVNSGSSCRHSDSALSRILTTVRSWMRLSFKSLSAQLSAKL